MAEEMKEAAAANALGAERSHVRPLDLAHALRHAFEAGKSGVAWTEYDPDNAAIERIRLAVDASPAAPDARPAMVADYNDWKPLLDGLFWLELRSPGLVPQRKGPWPQSWLKKTLREFMKTNPAAFISVVTITHDGPWFDDAPETLAILDGRTWPTGKKHIASSNAAHVALASADPGVGIAAARLAAEEMRERAAKVAERWATASASTVRLHGGEMTAQEIRTAQALAIVIATSIGNLPIPSSPDHEKATATPTISDQDGEANHG